MACCRLVGCDCETGSGESVAEVRVRVAMPYCVLLAT